MKRKEIKQVKWKELSVGDEVWELGQTKNRRWCRLTDVPYFYGPFKVHDVGKRELTNLEGKTFLHYPDYSLFKWFDRKV